MNIKYKQAIKTLASKANNGPSDYITEMFCDSVQKVSSVYNEPYEAVFNDVVEEMFKGGQ